MLAVGGIFARAAYFLIALGVVSLLISVTLYFMSRWAYILGLFTFPLLLIEFLYALNTNVNFQGWYPNIKIGLLNASLIGYVILLVFSFLLLIDKRNALKSDRILDLVRGPVQPADKSEKKSKSTP